MLRRKLVVGDAPAGGGRILPYIPPYADEIMGHQVAIIGGRVYCDACGSIGVIAKAGGSRRAQYLTEVALEGDLCVCRCPKPQPLLSTLQDISWADDTDYGHTVGIPVWESGSDHHLVASKVVDEQVRHPEEWQRTEDICPNMTNKEFAKLMMELRDEAIEIVSLRLRELERWHQTAKDRVLEWFGDPGFGLRNAHLIELRPYLMAGLQSAQRVLRGLEPRNFVRWSPTAHEHVGCVNPWPDLKGVAAQVCKPDIQTRTIAITHTFCELRRTSRKFGTETFYDGDSQLQTLIHEVTHFDDVFSSTDAWNKTDVARAQIAVSGDFIKARSNADSIVGYIMGSQVR